MKLKNQLSGVVAVVMIVIFTILGPKILFGMYHDFGVGINMPVCVVLACLAAVTVFVGWPVTVVKNPLGFLLVVKKHLWEIGGGVFLYVMSPLILRAVNLHEARYAFLVVIPLVLGVYLAGRVFHPGNISAGKFSPDHDHRTAVEPRKTRVITLPYDSDFVYESGDPRFRVVQQGKDKTEGLGRDRV